MLQIALMPAIANEEEHSSDGEQTVGTWRQRELKDSRFIPDGATIRARVAQRIARELKDSRFIPDGAETGPVTFLGVHTAQIGATLSAQLGLPKGMGLTVRYVVPKSPAAEAGLKEHDILRKLDDQILIHPKQLRVLIRSRDEGETASLTVLREGKEIKIEAKLETRDPAKYEYGRNFPFWFDEPDGHGDSGMSYAPSPSHTSVARPHLNKGAYAFARGHGDMDRTGRAIAMYSFDDSASEILELESAVAGRRTIIKMKDKKLVMKDREGVIVLLNRDGKRHLVAKDEKGNVTFSGPIDSAEERMNLPAGLREKLEELESTEGSQFDVEKSIHPEKMEFIRAYRGVNLT